MDLVNLSTVIVLVIVSTDTGSPPQGCLSLTDLQLGGVPFVASGRRLVRSRRSQFALAHVRQI
jgi:hypothetical protein